MARPVKLYNHAVAPNPRRVRIFAAEKGIELSLEEVDILAGQSRTPEFLAKNSSGGVPVLELDDGSYLSESVAICRYLEGLHQSRIFWGAISANRQRLRGGTGGWSWNCSPPSDARFKIPVRSFKAVSSNTRSTAKFSARSFISAWNG
jgi:glutathione S-transferase